MTKERYLGTTFEIDEYYFTWLCDRVDMADPEEGYLGIMRDLYDDEFSERTAKLVELDINRLKDVENLRNEFIKESLYENYSCITDKPCSTLEVMVELAYRLELEFGLLWRFEWFRVMFENLGLADYPDDLYFTPKGQHDVYHILRNFKQRKYAKDGLGGLFPLHEPAEDQRKKEIWHQAGLYFVERFL